MERMMDDSPYCAGCNAELTLENAWMEDGCPCNNKKHCNTFNWHRWRLLRDLQQQQCHQLAAAKKREAVLREAAEEFRDIVLHDRGALAEAGMDNDRTNAVLAEFDGTIGTALADIELPKESEVKDGE